MLPPTKLKVRVQGKAKKHQGDSSGVYTLQPKLVNSNPTWKQKSAHYSIWFANGAWVVGLTPNLGSVKVHIIGPQTGDDWPQNLSGWLYGDYDKNCFVDAESDVIIEDHSDGKLETHFNYS